MVSEVYLRSQIAATLDGLAAAVQHGPALAGSEEAVYYYAGYVAALQAAALSFNLKSGVTIPGALDIPYVEGRLALR